MIRVIALLLVLTACTPTVELPEDFDSSFAF
ncbi:MAG: DNA polymerase III subunit chi [Yoonia sp.]|nr:DNA polymerase III subunit chi [Yoonia sp.]MDP5084855.1 DNA polymerase III subunit chi [Yoonia sp.]MDP5358813.1 DNA polymerase III subunit chi [Paracoccaceae bacterium]MDP5362679.1 DNA polymerase III subunit chi [Paracoccaceae bacterium]